MTRRQAARVRLIRSKRSYSTKELAAVLQVTSSTVLRWRKQGLEPIDPEAHVFLFLGQIAKDFLQKMLAKRKHPLKPDEFFCPRCRCPRLPKLQSVEISFTGQSMGHGKELVLRRGICTECGSRMVRITTRDVGESVQTADSDTAKGQIISVSPSPCE